MEKEAKKTTRKKDSPSTNAPKDKVQQEEVETDAHSKDTEEMRKQQHGKHVMRMLNRTIRQGKKHAKHMHTGIRHIKVFDPINVTGYYAGYGVGCLVAIPLKLIEYTSVGIYKGLTS